MYGGHFVISKGSIHQEDITTPNFYVFNNIVPTYVKLKLREVQVYTTIVWNLKTPLSGTYRTKKTKEISETMENLKNINSKVKQINK